MSTLKSRIIASLLGGMVGDALGVPFETYSREKILESTGGKWVDTFYPTPVGHKFHKDGLPAGTVSDDTQLTIAVAKSIIQSRGFDLEDMAQHHVEAMKATSMGWGYTTLEAIKEFELFYDSNGREGRNPYLAARSTNPKRGGGNGVCMKIAPMAIYYSLDQFKSQWSMWCDVQRFGKMTHTDPRAYLSACALASAIYEMIWSQRGQLKDSDDGNLLLSVIIGHLERIESMPRGEGSEINTVQQLEKLLNMLGDTERIFHEITPGFSAITSSIYALGIFLSIPNDFKKAVLTAVNDGGDSDTTASMVGFLSGINNGIDSIPVEWTTFNPEFRQAYELGEQLYHISIPPTD